MATSSTGSIGGGIDVQGIVSQLMSIERQPLQKLQTTASGIQTKLSAIGRVQGAVSTFQSAAQELINLPNWRAVQATSSNESAVKATASAGAVAGTYDLTVNQLAQRQTLASSAVRERGLNGPAMASDSEQVGSGTLTISRGTYDFTVTPPGYTASGPEASVAIAAGDTLAQVRDKINAAAAGVTASIVTEGSQVRLALRSTDPSDTRAFRVLATGDADGDDTNASGLSRLAYDEAKAVGAGRNLTPRRDDEWIIGGGTLNITRANAAAVSMVIDPGSTLAQVRDKINASSAGVSATIVNDASGARLVLRSSSTGAANSVTVTVAGDSDGDNTNASGLSMLAYDPAASPGTGRNMTLTQAAQDASVTISGITVTSSTNTVTGAIENVALDLRQASAGNLTVTVATNTSSMRSMLDRFVTTWNDLNRVLADVTRFDPNTKIAGPLQGDNTVLGLQRQLRATLTATLGSGSDTLGDGQVRRLADAGLVLQRDGSLQINATKLDPLLASPSRLTNLFAAADSADPSLNGVARRLTTLTGGLLAGDGAVSASTSALRNRQTAVQQQQTRMQTRLTEIEQRLLRQYSAVNENITKLNGAAGAVVSRFG
jgi:flagellar hook-associated protein 2